MTSTVTFERQTKALIDDLKSVCANYGLGNDGNEFKIITQVFLYKFLNDKFVHEVKQLDSNLAKADNWEIELKKYSADDYEMLMLQLSESAARLKPNQFISSLFEHQNEANFAEIFDNTLLDIAKENSDIFSVVTEGGEKIVLFENISKYVTDKRDDFCKAIINKLIGFSFEHIFHEKFDFYATIFEYLISDYNTNSGGKYAEYFTPHAVAKIMASCLVTEEVKDVTCYDPSAGSGTLLMNLVIRNEELKLEIPEGWSVNFLGDWIGKDKSGDWGKEEREGNYTERVFCIRGADLNGLNGKGEVKAPERFILEKNSHKMLEPHDLIVEISGGSPTQSIGRMAYITDDTLPRFDAPIICSNFCKAVTLKEPKSLYNFAFEWNKAYDHGVLFGYEGKTSGIKNLLFESFVSFYLVPFAPISFMEKFYEVMTPIESRKQLNLIENQKLSNLRDWLLPMLMNGQVTVN
jgi:hypothetical protein